MNPRTTALLLIAALGLGAFVYFYEIGGEGARRDAEERGKRLFPGVEPADVSWIALRTSDGVDARFEQKNGRWELVAPFSFPADSSVERLADALATVTSEKTFDHPQPDAEYGLDDAAAKIVHFGAGGAEHVLRIGKATPIGANAYARTGDSPAVHTIANYRATAFVRSLSDLREKQVLSFDQTAIGELEATWPNGRVVVARAPAPAPPPGGAEKPAEPAPPETGDWKMSVPLAARADGDAIDNLLATLSFLRADAFIDAPSDAQRKLFEPPDFAVVLKNRDAQQAPLSLAISRADGDHRYVRASRDVLYQIAATRLADFPHTTVAYRERHLAHFPATDAAQLDFFFRVKNGDPVAIRAERGGDSGWTSTPESFANGKLASIVSDLSRLEASDILAESMGEKELEKLGLSPPNAIITAFGAAPAAEKKPEEAGAKGDAGKGGDASKGESSEALPPPAPRLVELHFGSPTPKGVAVQAVGDPIVYRLDLETAERLPLSDDAFQTRFRAQPPAPDQPPAAAPPAEPEPEPDAEPPAPGEDSP